MLKTLVKLAVFLLFLHALWQVVPPYWRYMEFKKDVDHLALTAGDREPARIVDEVLALAAERRLVVEREGVQVRRQHNRTYIDVVYVEAASPIPGWRVTRALEIHANALRF